MKLRELTLKNRQAFVKYLNLSRHELAVYAFENIYIWKALFDIDWAIIDQSLCVFFKDKIGCFLYLTPLSKQLTAGVVEACFKIMDKVNRNPEISRIENAEVKDLPDLVSWGYDCAQKSCDYLSRKSDLAQLKGDSFKSKRSSANYFMKHYDYEYLPLSSQDTKACLELYRLWARQRQENSFDTVYRGMIEDSFRAFKLLLQDYGQLNCIVRIVKVSGEVKGLTFGFPLNADTFCVLYELTDLSVKGLAQFIFREFCRELTGYTYINVMDDSGLENLKRVKLSYHPVKLIPAYIAKRKNA